METAWYFRLIYVNILWFVISWLLFGIIKAKRMSGPGPSKSWVIAFWISFITGWILTWFVTFSINLAFWIGLVTIVIGEVIFALGYIAMREHPEKKQTVVDWGIYKVSRHSHVLAGIICILGMVIIGWNPQSISYILLWVYFVLYATMSHFGVLNEEKLNTERFGQEYTDYMQRVPRYLLIK
ncbi:methyltransferase family protein [Chloroflexota bacterium]